MKIRKNKFVQHAKKSDKLDRIRSAPPTSRLKLANFEKVQKRSNYTHPQQTTPRLSRSESATNYSMPAHILHLVESRTNHNGVQQDLERACKTLTTWTGCTRTAAPAE